MTVSVVGSNNETVVFQTRKVKGSDLETDATLLDLDDIPMPTGVVDSNNATYTNFSALYADLPFNQNLKGPEGPQGPAIDTVSLSQSVDLSTVTMSFTYQKNGQTYNISTTPTFTIPAGPVGPQGVQGNSGTNGVNGVDGSDGVSVTGVNQPNPTTINFNLSDGTTTSNVTLPGGGGGSGTVTSVAVTGTNGITVSGSPVTVNGTIALSVNASDLKTHLAITYADIGSTPTTLAGYGITDAFDGAFASLTARPTTISGYGITDAFDGAFASLTARPTTISGYGITDAFSGVFADLSSKPTTISGYGITDAFDGVFASLTSKPTTLSGYGITDALSEFTFSVTAGSGVYTFNGLGTGGNNPTLYLVRGKTYTFNINASGHPFYINTTNTTGTGYQYTNGITGQGTTSGDLVFTVPQDAPKKLYYNCQYHSSMNGTIHILDHTFDFTDLGSKPTTIAGYGITDAFDGAFASLTSTPTTIAGYGITDAFDGAFASLTSTPTTITGYGITDAFDGAFSSLTSKPNTVAGYGITDALTSVNLASDVGSTVLPVANGGTGLTALGSAGQVLKVNSAGNALEYATDNTGASGADPVVMAIALG